MPCNMLVSLALQQYIKPMSITADEIRKCISYVHDNQKFNNRFHCRNGTLIGTHLPMSCSNSNYSVKLSLP